jgi:hypothetical protein
MTMHRFILITSTLTLTLACTDAPGADDEAGTTTSPSTTDADDDDSTTTDDESTSTSTSTSTSSDDEPTDGTSNSSSTDDGVSFLDGGLDVLADPCDAFAQDCPHGEKCVPYASDGGNTWDSLKCVPVQGDQATGEPCTYAGPVESTDDCDATGWCWDVDDNGEGLCHAFCGGTPDTPECPPMSECLVSGNVTISICLPNCDPLEQDCAEGEGCYWTGSNFHCAIIVDNIPTGEPCGYINDCQPGDFCVDGTVLTDCDGASCCANFCDLEIGDSQCAAVPETVCVSFFEVGMAPPEYEHVGLCINPL